MEIGMHPNLSSFYTIWTYNGSIFCSTGHHAEISQVPVSFMHFPV